MPFEHWIVSHLHVALHPTSLPRQYPSTLRANRADAAIGTDMEATDKLNHSSCSQSAACRTILATCPTYAACPHPPTARRTAGAPFPFATGIKLFPRVEAPLARRMLISGKLTFHSDERSACCWHAIYPFLPCILLSLLPAGNGFQAWSQNHSKLDPKVVVKPLGQLQTVVPASQAGVTPTGHFNLKRV
jgi:hypothetical protein